MKQTIRKHLSVLLALVMVLTLLPTVTVTARADGPISLGNETIPTLSDWETPLTLEAITDGTIVVNNPKSGMQYSINDGEKLNVTADAITVSAEDKVAFYGAADCYNNTTISGGTAQCYIYGNIMSLINPTDFANATALAEDYAFYELFKGNARLFSHPERKLVLPATTLADWCYANMFYGCENLDTAPELPATTLADWCYYSMFYGCTSLTTAPALPATTLANSCYDSMFSGCIGLTTAPALPATTLAESCYYNMFRDCIGLTTAPVLSATTLAEGCCEGMFSGCTGLTTAPGLPATALANWCYASMFSGCTSLTTAPELPADALAGGCYMAMFSGCTKLNAVTCLATDISAESATEDWLKNVASTGTFTKAPGTNWPTPSASGIPEGWTAKDYSDGTSVPYLDADGVEQSCASYTDIATDTNIWSEGWYVVKENVTIANTVTFSGDVHLILCDDATLTVNSATQSGNAITNNGSGSLTVYAQSTGENAGALTATAQQGSAIKTDGCAVTINGGKVTATVGSDSGSGYAGIEVKNGSLTINGGVVNASAAGYSNGICANEAPVTINGGAVTAESHQGVFLNYTDMTMHGGSLVANSEDFVGIYTNNANITVTGGDLTVTSESDGISANTMTISGGSVEINSAGYAAIYGNQTVTISGGTVEATGKTYGVYTWNGNVTFTGGDVTASATDAENASAVGSRNGAVVIGPGLRVDAGDDETSAVKVTKTFPETHNQRWAHIYEITESTYTLTIPAAVTVSGAGWNATDGVGASGELAKGKKLTVTAASGDAFALVCEGKGQIGYYLAATATDTKATTAWTFTALDDDPATQPMGIVVSEDDFSSARPGTYTDTVTFTAQVEDDVTLQKRTFVADVTYLEIKVDVDFYYVPGETWKQAIENHPTENTGWSTFDNSFDEIIVKGVQYTDETRNLYNFCILDANSARVDFDQMIDPNGSYTLAALTAG